MLRSSEGQEGRGGGVIREDSGEQGERKGAKS